MSLRLVPSRRRCRGNQRDTRKRMDGNAHKVGPPRNQNTSKRIHDNLLTLEAYHRLLQQENTTCHWLPVEAALHDFRCPQRNRGQVEG